MNENKSAIDKLPPQRKYLVEFVMDNLEKEGKVWKQGWKYPQKPISAFTGKQYNGVNNLILTVESLRKGYTENRWMTYRQIESNGYKFKTDEEGNSLGKGAGVPIEFYELYDKETKQRFDKSVLDGMTAEEKLNYEKENVIPMRRYYVVFNGDVIDGLPQQEETKFNETERNEKAEKLMDYWSKHEAEIIYGGYSAYYSTTQDKIHLPEREKFNSLGELYSTAFHEISHSTGSETRLNREIKNKFGDENYAQEELIAEFSSLFLKQDFGVEQGESIDNNTAYIKAWLDEIKDNPNCLFTAISQADKVSRYVVEKSKAKEIEYFAIQKQELNDGSEVYRAYMVAKYGQISPVYTIYGNSEDEVRKAVENLQELPYYANKEFQETDIETLQAKSAEMAEAEDARERDM